MEATDAFLVEEVRVRAEACAGQPGQHAELGLPGAAAENIDVKPAVQAAFGRQELLDDRFERQAIQTRIENRFVLDKDDVGKPVAASGHGRQQRQRRSRNITECEPADLPPGQNVKQRSHKRREEAARHIDGLPKSGGAADTPVNQHAAHNREREHEDAKAE